MLELTGLSRRFGATVALDGMSFGVARGRVVGFLGPNGSGKTTAMRAVFGLVGLDGGEVSWDGRRVGADERRRFGYMPEERGLYPTMKVGEQLSYIARLHGMGAGEATAAARQWSDRFGIADRFSDKVESLSLGNQQRAQLAAALVHRPDLLVLDEPFSGLDPVGIDTMSEVLREEAARGTAVLFSSHQLDLVEHVCQDVVIVDRGRRVVSGTVEELARGERPVLEVRVAGDPTGEWAGALGEAGEVVGNDQGTLRVLVAPGRSQQVLDVARRGGDVEMFAFTRRRLSEVFRQAVGQVPR